MEIDLCGEWRVQLDPENRGETEDWIDRDYPNRILLPGTLDERELSPLNPEINVGSLTRVRTYAGAAWFQREITVPPMWAGKRLLFSVERSKSTRVWFDGKFVGKHDTLTAEQLFELSAAAVPGTFRLTICVNNADYPPIGDPHQISDATQTNWNGLLGRIRLRARDSVWIENIQVFPHVAERAARIRFLFGGNIANLSDARLELTAEAWNSTADHRVGPVVIAIDERERAVAEATLPLGPGALFWDEFTPNLYRLRIALTGNVDGKPIRDSVELDFGLREFSRKGTQFAVNGRKIFLRGKHDGCVFRSQDTPR